MFFLVSQKLSFRLENQTSKNVGDTTLNILLWKFDTSIKKEMNIIQNKSYNEK